MRYIVYEVRVAGFFRKMVEKRKSTPVKQQASDDETDMKNRIKKRRFYFGYQRKLYEAKRLVETLQNFDPLQRGKEVWGNVVPVGREFGATETD